MKDFEIQSTTRHRNGGIEQAFLSILDEEGKLSEMEKQHLEHLKSLPQDRTEVRNTYTIKTKR